MAIVCTHTKGCQIHPNGNCPVEVNQFASPDDKPFIVEKAVVAVEKEQLLDLSTEDALHGTRLQARVLQAQLQLQQLQQNAQRASQALETFAQGMFQRHGVDKDEYLLDVDNMKFIKREEKKNGME